MGIFHRIFSSARDDWCLHHLPESDSLLVSETCVETRRRVSQIGTRVALNYA